MDEILLLPMILSFYSVVDSE